MNPRTHAAKFHALQGSILTTEGDTPPVLRGAVEAHAAKSAGGQRGAGEVPEELLSYVDKVTHHAYKVLDQDLSALKTKGYSEDALFEITLSTALGAAAGRLEKGLAALQGPTSEEEEG